MCDLSSTPTGRFQSPQPWKDLSTVNKRCVPFGVSGKRYHRSESHGFFCCFLAPRLAAVVAPDSFCVVLCCVGRSLVKNPFFKHPGRCQGGRREKSTGRLPHPTVIGAESV